MEPQAAVRQSLLIIDMQQASFDRPTPVYDATGLVLRINSLARRVREDAGQVIFIQFSGPDGTPYGPDQTGWQLLPALEIEPPDLRLRKPTSDAFQASDLVETLGSPEESNLIVTGCDTEFCIDSTVRSALALGYRVTVPSDGHSLPDRPHLTAPQIIRHHNAIWSTVGAFAGPVTVRESSEILT